MTRYYQVPVAFSEWRRFAQYSIDDCVMVFAVSRRTVCNWESGKIKPPRAVFICLQLFSGRLDFIVRIGKDSGSLRNALNRLTVILSGLGRFERCVMLCRHWIFVEIGVAGRMKIFLVLLNR